MKRHMVLLILIGFGLNPATTQAGLFTKKSSKPDPKDRVPELLVIIKKDKDEHKRLAAATELRQYDTSTFPQIVPVLIDVLMTDAKPGVRTEAAESLSKIRPVTKQAGLALEQALEKDPSTRVRLQARYALLQYHWAGYKNSSKDAQVADTKEPPHAPTENPKAIAATASRKQQKVLKPGAETPEPPLAQEQASPPSPTRTSPNKGISAIPVKSSPAKSSPPSTNDGPKLDPDD
jgi:hypothetical protein